MLDGFTAETLARAQSAFTVSFHIIFPAFPIGFVSYLMMLNAQWLRTGDQTYRVLFDYWKKIFAVAFGMGVVSGGGLRDLVEGRSGGDIGADSRVPERQNRRGWWAIGGFAINVGYGGAQPPMATWT